MSSLNFNPSAYREIIFIVFAVIVALISIYLDSIGFEAPDSWFQRSGALIVVLGVICESKHVQMVLSKNVGAMGDTYKFKHKFINHAGFLIALTGTVIWGYGDLLSHT